jgi:hypothetical protein
MNYKLIFFISNLIFLLPQTTLANSIENKSYTVELLLVEYKHVDGFNWGVDIQNAQKK